MTDLLNFICELLFFIFPVLDIIFGEGILR